MTNREVVLTPSTVYWGPLDLNSSECLTLCDNNATCMTSSMIVSARLDTNGALIAVEVSCNSMPLLRAWA
jgi:hypothetical protein